MVKEAMAVSLKYLEMLAEDDSVMNDKAFKAVMTELAEKYGQDPKEFMEKVISAMEEFVEEGE